MVSDASTLPWTDEQWARVQGAVQDAARRARVAATFLPTYGPLPPGQAFVPAMAMQAGPAIPHLAATESLDIEESATLRLVTISCVINLKSVEVHDPQLAAATQLAVRAATVLAHLEDEIVFNGLNPPAPGGLTTQPRIYTVSPDTETFDGLLDLDHNPSRVQRGTLNGQTLPRGTELATAVANAVAGLESQGQYGPFACVLGRDLYLGANQATDALVVPAELIRSYLEGGPLMRCGAIPDQLGIVVALGGTPIDLVVAHDLHLDYLGRTIEGRYSLRLAEKLCLRVKQDGATRNLESPDAAVDGALPTGEQVVRALETIGTLLERLLKQNEPKSDE